MGGARAATAGVAGVALLLASLAVVALPRARGEEPPPGPPPGGGPAREPDCRSCHGDRAATFDGGGHGLLARTLGAAACDACHGPQGEHATLRTPESARPFAARSASEVAAACARCHRDHPDHAVRWGATPWAAEGRTCLSCHAVHEEARGRLELPSRDGALGGNGCRTCHADVVEGMDATIHGTVASEGDSGGCEACHGPGTVHISAVRAGEVPAATVIASGACLRCHARAPETHARRRTSWDRPGLECGTCHRAHAKREEVERARATAPPLRPADPAAAGAVPVGDAACARCHVAAAASYTGSTHAAARDGKGARCEECHGAGSLHAQGGRLTAVVRPGTLGRAEVTALCLGCHAADGPEHALRFEGSLHGANGRTCLHCHQVHAAAHEGTVAPFADLESARAAAEPAGSAACAACHRDPHPAPASAPHAALLRGEGGGCESCHGPGGAHVASKGRTALILAPSRLEPRAADGVCLACHGGTTSAAGWLRHPHGGHDVRCIDCHDPVARDGRATMAAEPALCFRCHGEQAAAFRLPHRHPLAAGGVRCTDCHDAHRVPVAPRAAVPGADACARCHRAEATARLHPHEGDRRDGCLSCHEAHGTTAPRMLRFPDGRSLCLSCHAPPRGHDVSPAGTHADCVRCHVAIHGSDADRHLLR